MSKIRAPSRRRGTPCRRIVAPTRVQLVNPSAPKAISIISITKWNPYRWQLGASSDAGSGGADMRTRAVSLLIAVVASAALAPAATGQSAFPNFAPDPTVGWFPDRPTGDDFLAPESGPGPVMSDPAHPYVPNGAGQPTDHVADLSNPILQPWVIPQMKKANDQVLSGQVPFQPRERCWPGGVPEFDVLHRAAPLYVVQSAKEVLLIQRGDPEIRHIYLNVPHSRNLKPSWYGESVGHYEADELVVDTIGQNDKTFVDN